MEKEISERTRLKIALVSSVLSIVCIIPSIMLFSTGFYIQVAIQSKIRLIEDLDVAALPGYIITVGFFSVIYNSLSGAVVFLSRRKKKRIRFIPYLFHIFVTGLVIFLAVFISGLLCFSQIYHLSESFHRGIRLGMEKYKSDVKMKEEIDLLQIDYRCCGNDKYTDWFNASWIHEEYSFESQNMRQKIDDVPFSCCDPSSKRPCVHHHVHHNDRHFSYDFRVATTLYTMGCREALVGFYGHGLLTNVGALIISISLLQIVAVLLTRIVQTSMLNALQNDDPFGPANYYFFFNQNVVGDDITRLPMLEDQDDSDGFFTDSTFDTMTDEDEERIIANQQSSENIYEIPYSQGIQPPSQPATRPYKPQFPAPATRPNKPKFPVPAPPTYYPSSIPPLPPPPAPHDRLIPSIQTYN